MLRRYPFVLIFLLTALFICSAYYLRLPFDLRADTEFAKLDSLRIYRVHVIEPPVAKSGSLQLTVSLPDCSKQAVLYLHTDSTQSAPHMGDLLLVHTRITRPRPVFPDDFDYGNYLRLQHKVGVGYVQSGHWQCIGHAPVRTLRAYAAAVRQRLVQRYRDAGLTGRALAFVSAITLGERDALDSELRRSFAAAGAAHILAVSGLHTGIIYLVVVALLTGFYRFKPLYEQRLRRVLLSVAIILIMWAYAFVTGLSPSVMRAVVMLTIIQVGWMLRRKSISLNTLAAAACICLWANPLSLFSVSFQLSFSAVLGILLFVPYMNGIWHVSGNKWMRLLRDLVTVSIAATIGTLPVTLYYFGQVSHYFLLTNLVVLPAAYLLVIIAIATLLLAHTAVGIWLAIAMKYLSGFTCSYVSWIEHLPFSTLQLSATPWMVVCLVAAILFCYVSMQQRRLVWLAPAVVSVGLVCILHVSATKQSLNTHEIAFRNKILFYRHGLTIKKYPLESRYTFFRFDNREYVYAPKLTTRQQQALEQYCQERNVERIKGDTSGIKLRHAAQH